jgi:hypothetical protein
MLSKCNKQKSQLWLEDSTGLIRSFLNRDKCIQVKDSLFQEGKVIEINDCDTENEAQRWIFSPTGEIKSHFDSPIYCIDDNGIGETVVVWPCDGTPDQYWRLIP